MTNQKSLIILHDGAFDELMVIPYASTFSNYKTEGIYTMPSDCIGYQCELSSLLFAKKLGAPASEHIKVATELRQYNPFPWWYRLATAHIPSLPELQTTGYNPVDDAYSITVDAIVNQIASLTDVTLLVLCPLTFISHLKKGVADGKEQYVEALDNIEKIVWTGGVFGMPGSVTMSGIVDPPSKCPGGNIEGCNSFVNMNAEWNAFSDPDAVLDTLIYAYETKFDFVIFPSNVTQYAPVFTEIINDKFPTTNTPKDLFKLANNEYLKMVSQGDYQFWNTLTASYLIDESLFTYADDAVMVVPTSDPETGKLNAPDLQGWMSILSIITPGLRPSVQPLPSANIKVAMDVPDKKLYPDTKYYYSPKFINMYVSHLEKVNWVSG